MTKTGAEKRLYPRLQADTPVKFSTDGKPWSEGKLLDLSAKGISIIVDHDIPEGTEIKVEVIDGGVFVPAVTGVAKVIRCHPFRGDFQLACEFVKVGKAKRGCGRLKSR